MSRCCLIERTNEELLQTFAETKPNFKQIDVCCNKIMIDKNICLNTISKIFLVLQSV